MLLFKTSKHDQLLRRTSQLTDRRALAFGTPKTPRLQSQAQSAVRCSALVRRPAPDHLWSLRLCVFALKPAPSKTQRRKDANQAHVSAIPARSPRASPARWSAGLRHGIRGGAPPTRAVPEAGAPWAVSRCTRPDSRSPPNVPDQRPRATDARIGTETQSRGSLHPVGWAIYSRFLFQNQRPAHPNRPSTRKAPPTAAGGADNA